MLLHGCITALVTPFDASGAVDPAAMESLVERQLRGGVSGLVVAGSTGEAAALTAEEFSTLIRHVVGCVGGRVPVLAGTGLSSTRATVEQTQRAKDAGADAALVVTPPYVRPTQSGLVAHYAEVAAHGGLPVVLYNVPGRTGVDLLPETVDRLRDVEGIIGFKEAQATPGRIPSVVSLQRSGFSVLSGDDPTAAEAVECGASGVISVASNFMPASMSLLMKQAREYGALSASSSQPALIELFSELAREPNPIAIKALMAAAGQIGPGLRLPLLPSERDPAELAARAARFVKAERAVCA